MRALLSRFYRILTGTRLILPATDQVKSMHQGRPRPALCDTRSRFSSQTRLALNIFIRKIPNHDTTDPAAQANTTCLDIALGTTWLPKWGSIA